MKIHDVSYQETILIFKMLVVFVVMLRYVDIVPFKKATGNAFIVTLML